MICGIDPGKEGALAFITKDGLIKEIFDMPTVDGWVNASLVVSHLHAYHPEIAVIEKAQSMPKQGVAGVFKYGTGYGVLLGVVAAMDIPVYHAVPGQWKKHFHLSANKELSRRKAIDRWPSEAHRFANKKDHGRAEAALLALTWLEQNLRPNAPLRRSPTSKRVIRRR